jgi:signal transduction histidine kinase
MCEHIHADNASCGNTSHCATCNTLAGILNTKLCGHSSRECRMRNANGKSFDFRLTANSFEQQGITFTALTLLDISNEKRREVLERIFFHDLLNSVAGIEGLMDVLDVTSPDMEQKVSMVDMARRCAHQLVDDIMAARALSQAENGTLTADDSPVNAGEMMDTVAGFFINNKSCGSTQLKLHKPQGQVMLVTDPSLLVRVLINLIKNAVEASGPDGIILFSARQETQDIIFEVHDDPVIPAEIQKQLFERSFSTKGLGRGIGTYSVKLFTEKYLNGRVWFTSQAGFGTSFYVQIPLFRKEPSTQ